MYRVMYSVIELTKEGLIEVARMRTIEEAYDMMRKWKEYRPESNFDVMENV